ncbi:hypothetical protein PCASD_06467 [Puccinia coronata f. sp. avenae]|uniref:Uncharacterized protein n=1 Tax=Puccinia coronata f. sp. avenae TaxID=200324 RepID=A0A2N5RZF0_9BASI|nr:hypothetical protein PCASD_22249 [Puccinia coronata f. sp. avenae]PLW43962.1 hypothetical protein PCASD_06467 [Puccinia coronata f. sp. avenae]
MARATQQIAMFKKMFIESSPELSKENSTNVDTPSILQIGLKQHQGSLEISTSGNIEAQALL